MTVYEGFNGCSKEYTSIKLSFQKHIYSKRQDADEKRRYREGTNFAYYILKGLNCGSNFCSARPARLT
jgi:hypothetical protein